MSPASRVVPEPDGLPATGGLSFRVAAKLAELIRCRTVSRPGRTLEHRAEFTRHVRAMNDLFPAIAGAVEQPTVGIAGQLWHWRGGQATRPIVLMAHQDMAPVESEGEWDNPPFAGVIAGGRIHGRGTLDDKGDLACILEAADARFFAAISDHVYRFAPLGTDKAQRGSIHGTNQSVAIPGLGKGVAFYRHRLRSL